MAISSAHRRPQTEEELAKATTHSPTDGDGDGWIYDGTAQQRRVATTTAQDLLQSIRNTQHGGRYGGAEPPKSNSPEVKLLVDRGLAKIDRSGTVKLTGQGDELLSRTQRARSDEREARRQQWEKDNPHMAKLLSKYGSTEKFGEKVPSVNFRTMYVGERPKNPTVGEIKKMTPKQRKAFLQVVANANQSTVWGANVHFRQAESYVRRLRKAGFKVPTAENHDIPPGFQD